MEEEAVRRILMQLETGKRQMDQLSRQAQMVEAAIGELGSTIDALKSIGEQKPGTEILVPVGAGSYMKASIKDTETVFVGIGAEMTVEKKVPEAVTMMEGRRKQLLDSLAQIQKTLGELGLKVAELNAQAEGVMGQMQGR